MKRLALAAVLGVGMLGAGPAVAEEPLRSLVLLVPRSRSLDEAQVTVATERAVGRKLPKGDDSQEFAVRVQPGRFMVKLREGSFLVHDAAQPYFDSDAVAQQLKDKRQRDAVRAHKAWIAVDLLGHSTAADIRNGYATAGRVLAELAPANPLALFSPEKQRLWPWLRTSRNALRGGDPLEDLAGGVAATIVEVSRDDAEMRAAVAQARRTWSQFVAAFRSPPPRASFAAKAPFSEGTETEFMWVSVTRIDGDFVEGKLGNEPHALKALREGSLVRFHVRDLNDWLIERDGKFQGGFTVDVLGKRMGAKALPR